MKTMMTMMTKKNKQQQNIVIKNKMAVNMYLLLIMLNVNGLNAPIKRHRVAEWIRKQVPYICCL